MKGKKLWRIPLCLLLALLVAVGAYVIYALAAYHRIPDEQSLSVSGESVAGLTPGTELTLVSWNIGFGAYEADFSFFMDGGTQSWAWSEERLRANLDNIAQVLDQQNGDLLLLQEVDIDGTRSYHVNELEALTAAMGTARRCCSVFAVNYDSPFLILPFHQPHGANRAGMATFSAFPIAEARRRSLPVEEGLTRFLDLDRCYSVSRIPVESGHELVLYNLHLSAYTSDGTIAMEQLRLLLEDMQAEYNKGNWCIAGGDFNKDLLGDSAALFGVAGQGQTWAQPIPEETWSGYDIAPVAPLDEADPVPSCRNADAPYHEGQYVLTVDGFLVSANVGVVDSRVVDTQFQYSDHNPVLLRFMLR